MAGTEGHRWQFKARFRRHAFGWRSQPAIRRLKEAVSEIKKAGRREPVLAADGAVTLLERISPALEHVDGSSGAIGTAVNHAIGELVPIIARAPASPETRDAWLKRLWAAHETDRMPYIETLADHWGELCASSEIASEWADRLLRMTRRALHPDRSLRSHFHGTAACLSALYYAGRYSEIVDLLHVDTIWAYKCWAVKALVAMGKRSEAIRYAEACRGPWTDDAAIDAICEEILLSSGLVEEAYERYACRASHGGTYLSTFRAVARKYPHQSASRILEDLAATTPGEEGKWFAAAKEAGLYDEALALARRSPCDPRTLTRAARDLAERKPAFAVGAGLLALHWLVHAYGYDITAADVWRAYSSTMSAAEKAGNVPEIRGRIAALVASEAPGGFVSRILGGEFGQPSSPVSPAREPERKRAVRRPDETF